MPDGPYREGPPEPEGAVDLARLAAEGQHRTLDASARAAAAQQRQSEKQRAAAERHVRVALGGHYGSPVRVVSGALIVAGAMASTAAFFADTDALLLGVPVLIVAALVRMFAPPVATHTRLLAEEAWIRSAPFVIEGYLEALAGAPRATCRVEATIAWNDSRVAPREDVVRGVLGVLDTGARVESRGEATVTIHSSPISGRTGIKLNGASVLRNTRLVAYVHRLVDRVLVPIHRSHPIARVSLTRE